MPAGSSLFSAGRVAALKGYLGKGGVRRGVTALGSYGTPKAKVRRSLIRSGGPGLAAAQRRSFRVGARRAAIGGGIGAAYYDVAAGPQRATGRSSGATGMPPASSTGGYA